MNHNDALIDAIAAARTSTCAKSQRGAAIWSPTRGLLAVAANEPPTPFRCTRDEACRAACRHVAMHAEERAILRALEEHGELIDAELLHVKVVNGEPVPSGPPSCVMCSRAVVQVALSGVWLLHEIGLVRYTALDFHRQSLANSNLPAGGI